MILVKLPKIKGDSKIKDHTDWISVESLEWEITRELAESAKAGTQDINMGQPQIEPITMEKSMDRASCSLMVQAIAGGALSKSEPARIHFMSTAGTTADSEVYLEFKLANPIVSHWSITGESDERPKERFKVEYNKVWMEYKETLDGASYTTAGQEGWSRVDGKAWAGT